MLLLALVLISAGLVYAVDHAWPGTQALVALWGRRGPAITSWVRRAPLTYFYLVILAVTTWLLSGTSPRLRAAFLEQQGTDIHQLSRKPVEVLVRSALYVSPAELLVWTLAFTAVMAVLEHRIGWRRLVGIFAVGHVGATLLVAGSILWALHAQKVPDSVVHNIDVGASYGFAAVAAASSFLWQGWRRWAWAAGCVAIVSTAMAVDTSFTNLGHCTGVALGFLLARVVTGVPHQREAGPDADQSSEVEARAGAVPGGARSQSRALSSRPRGTA